MHVRAPGDDVTLYSVTGEPPSEVGAFHLTVTRKCPADPETPVGELGGAAGTATVVGDGVPVPLSADAATSNPYRAPLVRPPITMLLAVGLAVTVKGAADGVNPVTVTM